MSERERESERVFLPAFPAVIYIVLGLLGEGLVLKKKGGGVLPFFLKKGGFEKKGRVGLKKREGENCGFSGWVCCSFIL